MNTEEYKFANKKELFEYLFSNLYDNKLIFHERVTALCEVVDVRITEDRFYVDLKAIKPLILFKDRRKAFYERLAEKSVFTVGSAYDFGTTNGSPLYDGKKIGRPYCPYILWVEKHLVKKVTEINEEELNNQLDDLLWAT